MEDLQGDCVYRDANGVYWQLSPTEEHWLQFGANAAYDFSTPARPLKKMP